MNGVAECIVISKTRCRLSEGRRCIPDVLLNENTQYINIDTLLLSCRYIEETVSSSAQVKIQFRPFLKRKWNFWLSMLSINALFTPVGPTLKKQ